MSDGENRRNELLKRLRLLSEKDLDFILGPNWQCRSECLDLKVIQAPLEYFYEEEEVLRWLKRHWGGA